MECVTTLSGISSGNKSELEGWHYVELTPRPEGENSKAAPNSDFNPILLDTIDPINGSPDPDQSVFHVVTDWDRSKISSVFIRHRRQRR